MIQANDPAILTMTITPEMEKTFKGEPYFLEVEMLQGEREVLPDGRITYKLEIHDPFKAEILKEFVLKVISMSHEASKN